MKSISELAAMLINPKSVHVDQKSLEEYEEMIRFTLRCPGHDKDGEFVIMEHGKKDGKRASLIYFQKQTKLKFSNTKEFFEYYKLDQ